MLLCRIHDSLFIMIRQGFSTHSGKSRSWFSSLSSFERFMFRVLILILLRDVVQHRSAESSTLLRQQMNYFYCLWLLALTFILGRSQILCHCRSFVNICFLQARGASWCGTSTRSRTTRRTRPRRKNQPQRRLPPQLLSFFWLLFFEALKLNSRRYVSPATRRR